MNLPLSDWPWTPVMTSASKGMENICSACLYTSCALTWLTNNIHLRLTMNINSEHLSVHLPDSQITSVWLTMKIYPWLNEHQWWWCKTSCSAFRSPAAHRPDSPRASRTHHENLPLTHHEHQWWWVPPWWCETSCSACLSPTWLIKSMFDSS